MSRRTLPMPGAWLAVVASVITVACAGGATRSFTTVPGAPVGLELTEVASGLSGPTQIASDGSGGYVVAELNGGEREGSGRVLRFATLPGDPEILLEGLVTPTGVAVERGLLWVMERRRLTVGPLDDPTKRRIVLDDLPFNGRSQGTISPVPGGGILFDTSGRADPSGANGLELAEGSGTLWFLAGPDDAPEPFATGFKHAYAHAPFDDGQWFVTEISDGRLDGAVPPDEVVVARQGDDFGYPRCVGDRQPVVEAGGDTDRCASTPRSLAVLEAGSTPTGIAVAPWDPALVFVALWNRGELATLRLDGDGDADPGRSVEVALAAFERPQHLLADGDRLLITDHGAGTVLEVRLSSGP